MLTASFISTFSSAVAFRPELIVFSPAGSKVDKTCKNWRYTITATAEVIEKIDAKRKVLCTTVIRTSAVSRRRQLKSGSHGYEEKQ